MENNQKIIDRIRKLMALAEGTTHSEEAQSALAMAQKLAAQHHISISSISVEVEEDEVVHGEVYATRYRDTFSQGLAAVISANFRCIPYWQRHEIPSGLRRRFVYSLIVIGKESDAEIARTVFLSAQKAARNLVDSYMAIHGGGKTARNSYLLGWVKGLQAKFDAEKNANNSLALALIIPNSVKQEHSKMSLKRGSAPKVRRFDRNAAIEGEKDGRNYGVGVAGKKQLMLD